MGTSNLGVFLSNIFIKISKFILIFFHALSQSENLQSANGLQKEIAKKLVRGEKRQVKLEKPQFISRHSFTWKVGTAGDHCRTTVPPPHRRWRRRRSKLWAKFTWVVLLAKMGPTYPISSSLYHLQLKVCTPTAFF